MKVLVCGGRHYYDQKRLKKELDDVDVILGPISAIVTGGATGADALAERWAKENGLEPIVYKADWYPGGKLDRGAGPKRNSRMLQEHPDIDLVVAFPGGSGTTDMVAKAKKSNLHVLEIGR